MDNHCNFAWVNSNQLTIGKILAEQVAAVLINWYNSFGKDWPLDKNQEKLLILNEKNSDCVVKGNF